MLEKDISLKGIKATDIMSTSSKIIEGKSLAVNALTY